MANFYDDNADLQFYMDNMIAWDRLIDLVEYDRTSPASEAPASEARASEARASEDSDTVQTYKDVLTMVGELVAEQVATRAAAIDRGEVTVNAGNVNESPAFAEVFSQIKELGLHGISIPRELGGMNAPLLIYFFVCELLARADVSVMTHYGFHGGIAMALLLYSAHEGTIAFDNDKKQIKRTRFDAAIAEIVAGDAWGAMDITEPNAGSDMGALRTRAEQDEDGNWFVTGQKIFITSGHGKYHIVVARSETRGEEVGLDGLSLFLVPAYADREDGSRKFFATVERVEDKLGHHGSPTCTISFDRSPAFLLGHRGDGFRQMLLLMNNARLGVGFESIGLCEAAYRLSRDYAAQRQSMGKTIDRHELIADYLDEMRSDIQGLRALAVSAALAEETNHRLYLRKIFLGSRDEVATKRDGRRMKAAAKKARNLTPLLKFAAAERAVDMARRTIQIHGGVGYTREFAAEKLLRDALVLPIYEGTTQIQALMVMRDTLMGIMKNPQGFVRSVAQARWRSLSARSPLERRVARLRSLSLSTQQHLLTRTAAHKLKSLSGRPVTEWAGTFLKNWDPKRDFSFALLHAENLASILTDVAICDILLDQAKSFPHRREVLLRYLERAEPRCRYNRDKIANTGDRIVASLHPEQSSQQIA